MNLLPSFPLGGYPLKNHLSSLNKSIKNAFIPSKVLIPLKSYPHQKNEDINILIKENMNVSENQILATSHTILGLPIYCSIPGRIDSIVEASFPLLGKSPAAVINFSGSFQRQNNRKPFNEWRNLSELEILKQIGQMGVEWESSISLIQYLKKYLKNNLRYILVSLLEDNPYSLGKVAFFQKKEREILEGISILKKTLFPSESIIIAVNDSSLKKMLDEHPFIQQNSISVERLARRYPQSNSKMLIKTLLGIPFSQIGHPLSNGILIANPYQIYHIQQAIYYKQPKTEQIVTFSGEALKNSLTIKARIGTSINQILEEFDLIQEAPAKAVLNNPFWGLEITNFNQPITQQMNSISFLSKKEINLRKTLPCFRCGLCHNICPTGLNPTALYKAIINNNHDEIKRLKIEDCIECGLCSFNCPSNIPLAETIIKHKRGLTE